MHQFWRLRSEIIKEIRHQHLLDSVPVDCLEKTYEFVNGSSVASESRSCVDQEMAGVGSTSTVNSYGACASTEGLEVDQDQSLDNETKCHVSIVNLSYSFHFFLP